MTMKHTLGTALFVSILALGLTGCPGDHSDASPVEFSPIPFSGTGGFMATGGTVGTTGGFIATGGTVGTTGGFMATGGTVGTTGGFGVTGGTVAQTGGMAAATGGFITTGGTVGTTGGFAATGGTVAQTGGMAAATGGTTGVGTVSKATFTVTTKAQGGRYAPRHVMAIWIEDASGNFVKALAKHAARRAQHLDEFNANASQSLPLFVTPNLADAVTSATLTRHEQHVVTWNLTDNDGNPVPPGAYSVHFEVSDRDAAGNNIAVNFSTAAGPGTSHPADAQYYVGMSVVLE